MKQCPACKSTYTDDSLKFCLNDGAALSAPSSSADVTQQMTFGSNPTVENRPPIRVDIQSEIPTQTSFPRNTIETERKNSNSLAIIAIIGLLVVIAITGVAVAYFAIIKKDNSENVSVNPSPTVPVQNSNVNDTQSLKEELEKLKKQIQDQKISKETVSNSDPQVKKPATSQQGVVTATVNSPGDGFLSLRTEPNVKTGTQLVKIPTGTVIQIEDCQRTYVTIDSRRGRWCIVTYEGKAGWVFDAWLVY